MKKQLFISIPEPCKQRWDEMTATDKGAFCESCAKNVIDFTTKTENEIYNIVASAPEGLCGRFTSFQLQQPVRKTELDNGFFKWKAFAAMAGVVFSFNRALGGDVNSKSIPVQMAKTDSVVNSNGGILCPDDTVMQDRKVVIKGRVIDEYYKKPFGYAGAMLSNTGTEILVDENGVFAFEVNAAEIKPDDTLTVSFFGYFTNAIPISAFLGADTVTIEMAMDENQHKELMVLGRIAAYDPKRRVDLLDIGLRHVAPKPDTAYKPIRGKRRK